MVTSNTLLLQNAVTSSVQMFTQLFVWFLFVCLFVFLCVFFLMETSCVKTTWVFYCYIPGQSKIIASYMICHSQRQSSPCRLSKPLHLRRRDQRAVTLHTVPFSDTTEIACQHRAGHLVYMQVMNLGGDIVGD